MPARLASDDPLLDGIADDGFSLLAGNPFEEAVIVTSSKNNQISWVPMFSHALYQSFIDFNYQDDATIRQWLEKVKEHTLADAPEPQEPMFKGIPDSVLDKKLWMNVRKPESGSVEIAAELLNKPISPDGITKDQIKVAKKKNDDSKQGEVDEDGKQFDQEEDSGNADHEDDDSDDPKQKKKELKSKASSRGKNSGHSQCGTIDDGSHGNGWSFIMLLMLPLVATATILPVQHQANKLRQGHAVR